ncbi:hypothetical protein G7085_18950 [Tessaracoccus sp. HDW20]|uniref:hypothetical protein n=1 Tax=Tessaracoccus coleopterorum TaxID=2714950 RepID=UPI0018D3E2DE|nr:hypothetical protein [Tessaracoccus coleopterorum]NHB85916.1 hypothetical protein [Tessaracoccus coleopterorum]
MSSSGGPALSAILRLRPPRATSAAGRASTRPPTREPSPTGARQRPGRSRRAADDRPAPARGAAAHAGRARSPRPLPGRPARAFLRSAAGLPLYVEPTLSDDLPIELDGLGRWKVLNDLIEARKAGTALDVVVQRLRSSEELPPRRSDGWPSSGSSSGPTSCGRRPGRPSCRTSPTSRSTSPSTSRGWAGSGWWTGSGCAEAPPSPSPEQGRREADHPWLESLALTAAGVPTPGKLFRFRWDPVEKGDLPEERIVGLPDRDEALARLTTVVTAFALGQHRLITVPVDAGIHFAEDAARGRYREADWRGAPPGGTAGGARTALLVAVLRGEVAELFDDPRLDEDPDNGQPTAFGAWAVALYTGVTGRIG